MKMQNNRGHIKFYCSNPIKSGENYRYDFSLRSKNTNSSAESNNESGKSYVIIVIFIGLIVAAGAFFAAFITSQKAQTPKPYSNLKIPPIKIPTPPPVAPLIKSPPPTLPLASPLSQPTESASVPGEFSTSPPTP